MALMNGLSLETFLSRQLAYIIEFIMINRVIVVNRNGLIKVTFKSKTVYRLDGIFLHDFCGS